MGRWISMLLVSIVGVAGLTACGSDGDGASTDPSTPLSTLPEPSGPQVVTVLDDVDYYGACGNEILTTDEGTFYPLSSDEVDALDVDEYPGKAAGDAEPAGLVAAPRMVAPPGPGDDVGTLVIYSDGIARFESDSGTLRWLTDEPREYNFVC